ncbi:MAG: hypothetical protein O3A96_15435 [Proteobacteria bacterium]|nr:hypothetical protein [Pseudomonadota bacterium]
MADNTGIDTIHNEELNDEALDRLGKYASCASKSRTSPLVRHDE